VITTPSLTPVTLDDEDYFVLARPLQGVGSLKGDGPIALILRSRTERLQFLSNIRTGLAGILIVTLLLATLLSYGVARTMTRPLAAITKAMRDVAATGDLTRKVTLKSHALDDEDARTLAAAFNTLTESVARFQREATQRERLSSLGRLSTVIAHEVRNPLMIIRASLTTLRRGRLTTAELREAVADIDEETKRLNRVVTDVLDFARPIRFELAEADLNAICRASAEAAWTGEGADEIALDLDSSAVPIVTDAERLRTALVNVITNARHAVHAASRSSTGTDGPVSVAMIDVPSVRLKTRFADGRAVITIEDRGTGITPENMAHIFDPYFTTRRTGTGLGLPIAKNIVEGLGGTLTVSSQIGQGTAIRIDLPQSTHPQA
jgi:signal transduction histidine kinase